MIDTLVYSALTQPNLETYLKDANGFRVYPNGSLGSAGIPAAPERAYVQHGEQGQNRVRITRDVRKTLSLYWDVFVYDDPGSFRRIKDIIDLASENMEGLIGQTTTSGWRVTDLVFTNTGGDGYDPINVLNTKRASFLVVTSKAP